MVELKHYHRRCFYERIFPVFAKKQAGAVIVLMTAPFLFVVFRFFYLSPVFLSVKCLTAAITICLIFPFKRYSTPWTHRVFVSLRTNKALRNRHGKPVRKCTLRCYNFLCFFMPHRLPPLPEPSEGFRETPWDRYSSKSNTTPK